MPKRRKIAQQGVEKLEDVSIIELAKRDKDLGRSEFSDSRKGKFYTREVFKMWLVLPDQFKGLPERAIQVLGITDLNSIELLKIQNMAQFAQEFRVVPCTLSRWRKEIEEADDFFSSVKRGLKTLTKNMLGSLYIRGMEHGDAARVMAWMKIVEDWREQIGLNYTERSDGLTDEEKKALDELILKNTTRE